MRRYRFYASALVSLLLGFAAAAAENVNKCTDVTGKVIYQKEPCDTAQRGEQKQLDPNRNAVKMEVPEPSESPKPEAKSSPTPATPIIRQRRSGY